MPVKHFIQKIARAVADEGDAGPVGPAQAGSQANNEKVYRARPFGRIQGLDRSIVPAWIGFALFKHKVAQTRAQAAIVIWLSRHSASHPDVHVSNQSSKSSSSSPAKREHALRTLGWIAANLGFQAGQIDEVIGLAPQIISNHGRL